LKAGTIAVKLSQSAKMAASEDETEHFDPEVSAAWRSPEGRRQESDGTVILRSPDDGPQVAPAGPTPAAPEDSGERTAPQPVDDPESTRYQSAPPEADQTRFEGDRTDQPAERTLHAQQALQTTLLFLSSLSRENYGRPPGRKLSLAEPEGMSTEGGKRARQAILLVPGNGERRGAVVCGWLDSARKRIELRCYDDMTRLHLERFNLPFDLPADEYGRVERDVQRFAAKHRLKVQLLDRPPPAASAGPVGRTISLRWLIAMVILLIGLGIVIGVRLVLHWQRTAGGP
jgi:hypothetical protein